MYQWGLMLFNRARLRKRTWKAVSGTVGLDTEAELMRSISADLFESLQKLSHALEINPKLYLTHLELSRLLYTKAKWDIFLANKISTSKMITISTPLASSNVSVEEETGTIQRMVLSCRAALVCAPQDVEQSVLQEVLQLVAKFSKLSLYANQHLEEQLLSSLPLLFDECQSRSKSQTLRFYQLKYLLQAYFVKREDNMTEEILEKIATDLEGLLSDNALLQQLDSCLQDFVQNRSRGLWTSDFHFGTFLELAGSCSSLQNSLNSYCPQITHLDLSYCCNVQSIEDVLLNAILPRLIKLKKLCVAHAYKLQLLHGSLQHEELEEINLSGCLNINVGNPPVKIEVKLPNLRRFTANLCRHITDIYLTSFLTNSTQLEYLEMDKPLSLLSPQLGFLKALKILKITNCKNITKLSLPFQSLTELDLSGLTSILIYLLYFNLIELYINDESLKSGNSSSSFKIPFGTDSKQKYCLLSILNLHGCLKLTDDTARDLLQSNPELTSVNISECPLVASKTIKALSKLVYLPENSVPTFEVSFRTL
jgi:hypothetical protein